MNVSLCFDFLARRQGESMLRQSGTLVQSGHRLQPGRRVVKVQQMEAIVEERFLHILDRG
jgi:hypothetical protein